MGGGGGGVYGGTFTPNHFNVSKILPCTEGKFIWQIVASALGFSIVVETSSLKSFDSVQPFLGNCDFQVVLPFYVKKLGLHVKLMGLVMWGRLNVIEQVTHRVVFSLGHPASYHLETHHKCPLVTIKEGTVLEGTEKSWRHSSGSLFPSRPSICV